MNAQPVALFVTAQAINEEHRLARSSAEDAVQHAIRCGELLLAKKAELRHGQFMPWIEANCEFAWSTAKRYCLAAQQKATGVAISSLSGLFPSGAPAGRHGHLQGEYEWYTPAKIIEAAREVMGCIDLDPASCAFANDIVQAHKFFTEAEDGIAQEWQGCVFINPPFAHPTVKYFAEKLLSSFSAGSVEQAIWLSNACVDVEWWQDLAGIGTVCFHRGRIKFYGPEGKLQPPTLGQSVIYLGTEPQKFKKRFREFGVVLAAA
jgi:hypothetical protein